MRPFVIWYVREKDARNHFAARGGDLVHLVYLVRGMNHTRYIRTTTQTGTTSRSPRVLAIHYQPYALLFRPSSRTRLRYTPANQYHHPPRPALRFPQAPPRMAPMPFSIRPFRRCPVHCSRSYNVGPPGTRHGVEPVVFQMATLQRSTHASRRNPRVDRHSTQ